MGWILRIDPAVWAQNNPEAIGSLKFIGWLLCSLAYSSNFLIFGWFAAKPLHHFFAKNSSKLKLLAQIAAIWIIAEFARAVIVSITTWGSGAAIGPYWNFNALGFALGSTPIGNLASFLGLYGLGAAVLVINMSIYLLWRKQWRPIACIAAAIILLVSLGTVLDRANGRVVRAGVIQTSNLEDGYQSALLSIMQNQTTSSTYPIDVLVLPEGLRLESSGTVADGVDKNILTQAFAKQPGLVITTGLPDQTTGTIKAILKNSKGEPINSFDKRILTPVGEYLPLALKASYSLTGNEDLETAYSLKHQSKRGTDKIKPFVFEGVSYGTLSCSGINSSTQYQSLSNQGANILVNSANLEVFDFGHYSTQIKQIAGFQAKANARPFIQSTNRSYSYIVDANGKFIAETKDKNLAFIVADVKTSSRKTLFSMLGEWTVWVAILFLVVLGIKRYLKQQGGPFRHKKQS